MKNIILIGLLIMPGLGFSQSEAESALVVMSKAVAVSSCENNINYKELFSLALSGQYKGAATMEWLSEINETALFKCPVGFLRYLSSLSEKEQNVVLKYFGIVNPPWVIAAALKPYENSPELSGFINGKLGGFKNYSKP
ncbi:hypothetical protein [Teredinibacter turnerae]|uniref:hypothetical protein n=1 Tax=Teredinibacter turnerae TaxID=2426 RepID=UPI00048E0EF6|nr:hypothetical protein [Teredinibacter turnerae]